MLDQIDLIDIYRNFHPKETKYKFFPNSHGTFSKIDHIVWHKTSLNEFKKFEVISNTFSDHNGLKPTSKKKKTLKNIQIHGGWITCY